MRRVYGMLMGCRLVRILAAFSVLAMVSVFAALEVCAPAPARESAASQESGPLQESAALQESAPSQKSTPDRKSTAGRKTPRKPAKQQPPNEEYLRKVIKWNPWFLAAASGDAKTIQDYLTSGTQVNARDTFGRTALYIATAYEHADAVRLLLKAGADPNLPSEELKWRKASRSGASTTQTPLEASAASGSPEIQSLLTGVGARMEAPSSLPRDTTGLSPFCRAIEEESTPTLQSLLKEKSFTLEKNSHTGMTVPLYALMRRRVGLFTILLEQGLGPSGTQEEKNALLEAAVVHCRTGDVRRLLGAGISINSVPEYRISDAMRRGNMEFRLMLLDAGVKPPDWLMSRAVETGSMEVVKMLEAHGMSIDGQKANTLLPKAVTMGKKEMVEYLLTKGADPNAPQTGGFTLVEISLIWRRQDMADLLVQRGAKPVSEERRSVLLNPPRNYTVTTETLVSADSPSTGSLAGAIDLTSYSLYQVTKRGNTPDNPFFEAECFLVFANSPDRISLGSEGGGLSLFQDWGAEAGIRDETRPKEWIRTKWAEPGRIAAVAWLVGYSGSGGITLQHTSILLVNGNRVTPVFTWNYEMHAASGVSHWQNADQTWLWDVSRRILTIHLTRKVYDDSLSHQGGRLQVPLPVEVFRDFMPPCRVSETTRRYQLAGEEMRYVEGKQVEKIAGGFPVLDAAEEYELTIRRLVELNPELQGKVFCAGPVVVSTSIPPIDKDR